MTATGYRLVEGCVGAAYMRPTYRNLVGSHICDPYKINSIRHTLRVNRDCIGLPQNPLPVGRQEHLQPGPARHDVESSLPLIEREHIRYHRLGVDPALFQ